MKNTLLAPIFALALAAGMLPPASAGDHAHGKHSAHASQETPLIEGVVRKVDAAGGKLTISHGPLPNGMPAMTMSFKAKDPSWVGKVKEGDKVRFATEDIKGVMTLVRLEAVK